MAKTYGLIIILAVIIFDLIFFYAAQAHNNAHAQVFSSFYQNLNANNPDNGFTTPINPFNVVTDRCSGNSILKYRHVGGITINAYYLPCSEFSDDISQCNSFSNCNYTLSSVFFGLINTSGCKCINEDTEKIGNEPCKVNLSFYGFAPSPDATPSENFDYYTRASPSYCNSLNITGLNNKYTCEQFGCTWLTNNQGMENQYNFQTNFNTLSLWETIKFVVSFQMDFGFGPDSFVTTIITTAFYLINGILLFAGFYLLFIPF